MDRGSKKIIIGMRKRMGDEVHQDQAVTLVEVNKLVDGI